MSTLSSSSLPVFLACKRGAAGHGAPGLTILLGAFSLSKRWVTQNLIVCPSKPCLCGRSLRRSLSRVRAQDASATEHDLLVYEVSNEM